MTDRTDWILDENRAEPARLTPALLQELERMLKDRRLLPESWPQADGADETDEEDDLFCDLLCILNRREAQDAETYVRQTMQAGFHERLFRAIDEKGLTDAQVYHRAQIDRRLFAKIRADPQYHPSKRTALALALGLCLALEETRALLNSAGHALSESLTADVVVQYCIERGIYDLMQVNEALAHFGQPTL